MLFLLLTRTTVGRLWIYLALLDSLLGSYLRMFYEDQKMPAKHYLRYVFNISFELSADLPNKLGDKRNAFKNWAIFSFGI